MSSVSASMISKVKVQMHERWDKTTILHGQVYKNHADKDVTKDNVLDLVWKWVKSANLPKDSCVTVEKGVHQITEVEEEVEGDGGQVETVTRTLAHIRVILKGKKLPRHIDLEKIPVEEGKESKANGKGGKACGWRLATEAPAKPAKPAKPAWEPPV